MIARRSFLAMLVGGTVALQRHAVPSGPRESNLAGVAVEPVEPNEDLFAYIQRVHGRFDAGLYKRLLGAANEFKEGDAIVGVAAADEVARERARALLAQTRLADLDAHPLLVDELYRYLETSRDRAAAGRTARWTVGELKQWLLDHPADEIRTITPGLSSEVIGCLVKLMSNAELIALGGKVFHPLPGTRIGAPGYLGARIQPNSPTDHVDDIRWQVLDGWSYAVGDVVLGNNPVSSEPASVAAIERTLRDLLETFGLQETLPHCVLSHIDVQAEVERLDPGSTALWFQSIAGSDTANATFDIDVEKMRRYARSRSGPFGLYFETGQGADFTNGHGHGFDMVVHESRKYGFARALSQEVARARAATRPGDDGNAATDRDMPEQRPWVHLNDVAGFIGPEVFRTREQLVRCCLEDIVMGKLHGLCIGLDVCSTLHMDISLDDLDWCLEQVMPAQPAYLMALPTKIDPMLGYLTTGFQDHVRLREKFGYRVDDRMARFFHELGVLDTAGRPTDKFGDPGWVYLQYRRRKGDRRTEAEILREGKEQRDAVRRRGVFLAEGYGSSPATLAPELERDIRRIYADAKQSIWAELSPTFIRSIPEVVPLSTRSADRLDYILHPVTGEQLSDEARSSVGTVRRRHAGKYDVQLVLSDGLNALALMDPGQLAPYLAAVRAELEQAGFRPAPEHLLVTAGRVRAGYRIGEQLFGGLPDPRAILHVIGERPGSGHRTFSIYITAPDGAKWQTGKVDHDITRVVSGVATTALDPRTAAQATVRILKTMVLP